MSSLLARAESLLTPLPARRSLPMRVLDRVLAPLCLLGSLLAAATHGRLALGLVSFYLGLQCGALHLVRVLGYELPASARYATAGVALGVAFSLHAVLRAAPDAESGSSPMVLLSSLSIFVALRP